MFKSQSWFGLLRIASVTAIGAFLLLLVTAGRAQDAPGSQTPDVVQMVGPVVLNADLRTLPYIPNEGEMEEEPLMRYPHPKAGARPALPLIALPPFRSPLEKLFPSVPTMPTPVLTFNGINSVQSACGCLPPDTNGDVGPNHYVQSVNSKFAVYDKSGGTLLAPTTFNSFFATLAGTPCANANKGDPFVLYDHLADRWVISDFAFPAFPGTSFYQCVGVSQTADPVAGGWFLYAVQIDAANNTRLGDYPKFGLWPDGYYFTVNEFTSQTMFVGVRVFALDRVSMIAGGVTHAVAFDIGFTGLGDSYSLVASTFRTGNPPPAGRDEMLLAIDSPPSGGTSLTQVKGWKFHVDFVTPGNSTLGLGANHTPNSLITVNPFVDAFTNSGTAIVPQSGTTALLQTLGDKLMTPVVYQNRAGTESLWADSTTLLNYPNGPTAVRWYQFNVTGGNFPATPIQQQDWSNGSDGLWRFMPSIAVDQNGNAAVGYSTSSASIFPGVRYAGRLTGDPLNNLGQGEAIMTNGGGSQTSSSGRWGDYSMTTVDPSDGLSFWTTNEYYTTTANASWATSVGKFQFPAGGGPTPTPTPTPCGTPTYTRTTGTGATLVAGTTLLTGSNCDDCSNAVPLPFTFNFYGQPFTTVNAISNGNLQFSTAATDFTNACLPYPSFNNAILPHWDDLLLTNAGSGIYTSVSGAAPNRILNIEWRGGYYNVGAQDGTASFEARLYETTNQIDLIYATLTNTIGTGNGLGATVGLQKDTGSTFDQFECNTGGLSSGFRITYVPTVCATPTPTPTPTPSPTPSPSPTPVVSISGHIFYADPGGSVKNALMTLTGNNGFITQTVMTDTSGNYAFNGLPAGNNYTVTPSKTGDANGLESFDAADAARYVAGLDVPTANQRVAADADGDTLLTSFDASLIARFVAGFPDHGIVGTWRFIPLNRNYPALATNQPNQNYVAILIGDTSGDWFPTGPGAGLSNGTPSWTEGGSDIVTVIPQPAAGVTLALPKVTALPGAGITIPVTVGDLTNRGVKAFDLDIAFDPTMLQPQVNAVDTQGTLAAGMLITSNTSEPGHLIISAFRATDIGGAGTLINLKFTVTGSSGRTAVLSFADYTDANALVHPAARFNAGSPIALTVKGSVAIGGRSDAGSFSEKLTTGFQSVNFVLPDRKFAP